MPHLYSLESQGGLPRQVVLHTRKSAGSPTAPSAGHFCEPVAVGSACISQTPRRLPMQPNGSEGFCVRRQGQSPGKWNAACRLVLMVLAPVYEL